MLTGFPGDCEVVIELSTSIGDRRLKLGPDFRVAHSAGLHAELDALLGHAILSDGDVEADNVSVESERRRAAATALSLIASIRTPLASNARLAISFPACSV